MQARLICARLTPAVPASTPFNAEAVKFNIERTAAEESTLAGELQQVSSVDVVDEYVVEINVTGGLGSLSVALAARPGIMVSPEAVQSGSLDDAPAGIGPYVMTETVAGDYATFEKSADYWAPEAQNVAKRTYQYMPDDQTRYNALASGEVDGVSMSPTMLDDAQRAGLQSTARPTGLFLFLALNSAEGELANPEVMKAINMAIDREAISEGLYDGLCVPQIQPFAQDSPGYSDELGPGLDVFAYDPDAAKGILAEQGVESLSLSAVTPNVTIYTKFAEAVQAQLGDIGVDVSVSPKPSAQIVEDFAITKSANAMASVYTGIADPDGVVQQFLTPQARYNPGEPPYDTLIELAEQGAAPVDPAERNAAYVKFMDAWADAPPHVVPACMIYIAASFSEEVSGVLQTAGGITDLLRNVAITPA
ncbi:MAG: ABC transporter substrate-binding protein [Cumulibacter sp.]